MIEKSNSKRISFGKMKNYIRHILLAVIIWTLNIFCAAAANIYTKTLSSGNTTIEINTSTSSNFTVKENGGSASEEYSHLGNITVTGGTHTITFNTTSIVYLDGQIKVTGGTLYVKLGEQHTGGSVIKRYDGNPDKGIPAYIGALFLVENSSSDVNACKLYIEGHSVSRFSIHGYGDFNKPEGDYITGYEIPTLTGDGNGKVISNGALISVRSGYVEMNRVTLTRNYNDSPYGSVSGGAVTFYNDASQLSGAILKMNDCVIDKCYEKRSGAAIYFVSYKEDGNSYIEMENCNTQNCFTYGEFNDPTSTSGGTYRTVGKSFCTIKMLNCKIHENISNKASGGVSWNSGRAIPAEFNNCEIYDNEGGGLGLGSSTKIIGCKIHGNINRGSGGGISFGTYSSNEDIPGFKPFNSNLVLDSNTEIYDNEALNGGGIYFEIKPMIINESGKPWTVIYNNEDKPYETSISIEGAKIYGNKALHAGGGLYFSKQDDTPEEYLTDLNLKYGDIYKNEAGTNGGGFYVQGAIPVKVGVPSEQIYFYDNTAVNNGGAFYVGGGNVTVTNGFLGKEGAPNIAQAGNGGAIYLNKGNITFSGGSMSYNKAQKAATGTTTGMGGAVYINAGDITIDGGTIQRNHADRNGGAVYTSGGSTTIKGGEVTNNTADDNGGAMYLNGNLTFESGTLESNTATNNGGGAYVNGGIVTFDNGILKLNTAKNGGGIYLASGASMTFTDGLIAKNHALKNGNDITTAYNAKSTVSTVNGCGGGIYLQSGASSDKKTALTINVVNNFGLYGNIADRAGDDIVAEGVNTSVTVPNVTAMDLKDFEGKDAHPNWYEDYVYVKGGSDSGYAGHSILKYSGGSGNRFKQMLVDGSGDIYNHLVTFDDDSRTFPTSAGNDGYVCLSLGYTVLSAIIRATGLNEKESMYFTLEQLVKPEGASDWTVRSTYPVLLSGTTEESVQRTVRNLLPGYYRVREFRNAAEDATKWAWAYQMKDPTSGVIEKLVTKEDGVNNLFPFTVKHVEGDTNVLHDEEYKVNKMLNNAAIVPNIGVEDYKKKNDVHVKF